MNRARRHAGGDLVHQPVLDLVGRQAADPVAAEAGEEVLLEVAPVGVLRRRRESPGEREKRAGPVRERCLGPVRIDPAPALQVDLHLAKEMLGVGLAREGLAQLAAARVAVAGAVAAVASFDEPHPDLLSSPPGSVRGARGEQNRGF
jgi:hypothetical protein